VLEMKPAVDRGNSIPSGGDHGRFED